MTIKSVCVIGAGPSGITAAKNLRDQGLQVTVFEQSGVVGGNWVFSDEPGHSSVFETTHIISSKALSQYDDYPMPADYPDYPSHRQLAAYFQGYAEHFKLYPHIQFNTTVLSCIIGEFGKWNIVIKTREGCETKIFDALAVCNGHHWNPRLPQYPGHFSGRLMHSHAVKRFSEFKNRKVLVIGGGNSACDVAVETSRVAERVDMSWRRGYWVIPKFMMGKPADVFSMRLHWLPQWIWQRLSALSLRFRIGSNRDYGLPEPEGPIGIHHPTINEDLFYTIRHGKIKPRPDLDRLEGNRVFFKDGQSEEYDDIIACTGYVISHPFFEKSLIDYSEGEVGLWLKMIHPDIPNLYFIGLFQPLGCIWPGAELQSKIMARELAGKWKRPGNVKKRIRKELDSPDYRQINTPRHTITVNYHRFRERLLEQLK
ncbi:MAG: flavin-containing monooxygenase [Cyclobacteriaceae bacterium]